MKMTITKDYPELAFWNKHPRGYAVVLISKGVKFEAATMSGRIELVRVTGGERRVLKQLEEIREVRDIDPNGMRPRLVVLAREYENDPACDQFMRRAEFVLKY